jgi:hypothetical protein
VTLDRADKPDDEYYLRWNPSGDYESDDDDWWREVTALERKEHRKRRKVEKKKTIKGQKTESEALYLRYKYHTKKVLKWGYSTWANHYSTSTRDSDIDGAKRLSLTNIIRKLNDLARDGVAMPPVIYRNLEHAVELREEFQIRFVSQRQSEEEGKENRKRRRKRKNTAKASQPLSLRHGNSGSESGKDNGVDKIDDGALMNIENDTNKIGHRWIIDQLKALLNRFCFASDMKERCNIIPVDDITVLPSASDHSIREDDLPEHPNKSRCSSIKSKELLEETKKVYGIVDLAELQQTIIENDDIVTRDRPSSLKTAVSRATNERSEERVPRMKEYGSIWLQDKHATKIENSDGDSMRTGVVCWSNSETPKDWETLLEDEEVVKEGTVVEEAATRRETVKKEVKLSLENAMPKGLRVRETKFFTQGKSGTCNKQSKKDTRQEISDRVFSKLEKAPYVNKENITYDSIWDIFGNEMTISGSRVAGNDSILKSAISVIENTQPEDDWEALYS